MLPRMLRVKGYAELDLDYLRMQGLLSKKNGGRCQCGMRPGTSKGLRVLWDFSLPGMEAPREKPQQGTTCNTLAPGLWHGHLHRATTAGLSDFLRRHLIENKKLARKFLRIKNFT